MNQLWLAFVTGLTTGGVSCLTVQGGLLSSAIAGSDKTQPRLRLTSVFLISKLIAYSLLGAGLGFAGSKLIMTPTIRGWLLIMAGLFMILTAARLLNLHPALRYLVITPPRWALRLARNQARIKTIFSPAILGFLTVFIPCGITQTTMALAIASANPLSGAGIMFAFTAGTSPVFLAMGAAFVKLLEKKAFTYLTAAVILILGLSSVNSGQVLRGSVHTFTNYYQAFLDAFGISSGLKITNRVMGINEGVQEVTINVLSNRYQPSATTLKAGTPVRLSLQTKNVYGCIRAFAIPSLNISKVLPATGEEVVEFTPEKPGKLVYTCSMGMYSGYFEVI